MPEINTVAVRFIVQDQEMLAIRFIAKIYNVALPIETRCNGIGEVSNIRGYPR